MCRFPHIAAARKSAATSVSPESSRCTTGSPVACADLARFHHPPPGVSPVPATALAPARLVAVYRKLPNLIGAAIRVPRPRSSAPENPAGGPSRPTLTRTAMAQIIWPAITGVIASSPEEWPCHPSLGWPTSNRNGRDQIGISGRLHSGIAGRLPPEYARGIPLQVSERLILSLRTTARNNTTVVAPYSAGRPGSSSSWRR